MKKAVSIFLYNLADFLLDVADKLYHPSYTVGKGIEMKVFKTKK